MFTSLATVLAVAVATANAQVYYLPADAPQQQQQQQQQQPQQQQYQPAQVQVVQPANPLFRQVDLIPAAPVYGYIPPSPIAPPCPRGYTCCGMYKHYDPDQIKRCCGERAYTPSLQSCSNGEIVSIVQAQPPPPPTPRPVYVQRVELVCDGVKWQVPYPNFRCCGPSVYNVANEQCTADGVQQAGLIQSAPQSQNPPRVMFPVQPAPAPTTTTEAAPTTTKSYTKVLICQGRRYSVPAADYQFYACCGYEAYFWIREQCINGQISPSRPSTTTTSANPIAVPILIVCDSTQHWVSSEDRPYIGCCGPDTYDIRVETCRQPLKPTSAGSQAPAPAPASNCPQGFICCSNLPAVENYAGNLQCCPNIGPYDPSVSSCPAATGK